MPKGMGYGSSYGHKGLSGAYGGGAKGGSKNPLKGKAMPRGPKDPTPSHKGHK